MIFMSVMLEKFRIRVQEMLKYMCDIRYYISCSQIVRLVKYDEQYCFCKVSYFELFWGVINYEFWFLYVIGQVGFESKVQVNNVK